VSAEYSGGIPVLAATYALGEQFSMIPGLAVRMVADVSRGDVVAANVIAESIGGDPRNVVMAGAHLDSFEGSPGINTNGSGAAALLEVAEQMGKVKTRNKVRFAWWGSRFNATRGSDYYVGTLTSEEIEAIALYLEFASIGSPNFVRFVYDGDGSEGGTAGAPGSEAIEALFSEFYAARGLASEPIPYQFSDDFAFYVAGIPTGGIYTGTFEIKTPDQALIYGGTAGDQLDPCYLLACDTLDNVSFEVLEQNAAAVAYSVLQYAMNTRAVNGKEGKGNFK
jgi:Zn-dependent M28 family amino/carboxypeptidase